MKCYMAMRRTKLLCYVIVLCNNIIEYPQNSVESNHQPTILLLGEEKAKLLYKLTEVLIYVELLSYDEEISHTKERINKQNLKAKF